MKTWAPGNANLVLTFVAKVTLRGSDLGTSPVPPVRGLMSVGGERWSVPVDCGVATVEEMLVSSEARRGRGCELEADSAGSWKRIVSYPGFFFCLPAQLRRIE